MELQGRVVGKSSSGVLLTSFLPLQLSYTSNTHNGHFQNGIHTCTFTCYIYLSLSCNSAIPAASSSRTSSLGPPPPSLVASADRPIVLSLASVSATTRNDSSSPPAAGSWSLAVSLWLSLAVAAAISSCSLIALSKPTNCSTRCFLALNSASLMSSSFSWLTDTGWIEIVCAWWGGGDI